MENTNFQLAAASIFLVISVVLAFAALVFAIKWEITWWKKRNRKEKVIPFSEGVNDGLELTLDIKAAIMAANKQ